MSAPPFVHLHVHTHYSLLDGATRIAALIDRAKQYDMPAVAITDHGNMFGAIDLYRTAVKAGIKPIIGCETYLTAGDRRAKEPGPSSDAEGHSRGGPYHQLLLAMNLEGYKNLTRLSTIGYTEGFYRKPRIDKEVLREFSAGIICTSTCLSGEIPKALLNKDRKAAEELAKTYLEIFGPDRFFIELQDHGLPEQRMINPELVDMAKKLGVATIATNDVHYLEHDDVEAHDVLCCINTGKLLTDTDRFKFDSDQFYFKSPEEMAGLFPDYPEAIANTLHVADMCELEIDLSKRHAPVFRVPEAMKVDLDVKKGEAEDAALLRKKVYEGAAERYETITDELRERIDYELEVITSKGFASYFLIVWDCVNYAREHGIPVGARGSGCSSVVAHCLYISSPDPIRYGLYFERFMDPDRDEMPDIDLDICQNGRADLIEYVRQKYQHVAQIITFGTLKAKAAIKDVARVMGLGFEEANKLTKLIPNELKMTLDKALSQEPELRKRYEEDELVHKIIDVARRLEGVARNAGIHAAGVVVADEPLVNLIPLYKAADQGTVVTQFDGPTVEAVGLLKMDFLGLRTLTILERARQLAERSAGKPVNIEHLDLTDEKVFDLFARGDTKGIFQFESGGMRDVIMRMKPNRIEDLIAANALYRPGPMEYIPEYISRKHGAKWDTPHPIMTEVLEETYGIMVYQEQVSRMVNRLGGIELKAAFRLAKAISKKKTDMIEAMREPFMEGCASNGVSRNIANDIFEDILKFGGYAFNKAHSTGYALIAYQTAWMKTYYPVEFMAAVMTFEMSSTEKVAEYREACKEMGITIKPPDINASEFDFVVASGHREGSSALEMRFGLGAIKGVGAKAVSAIVESRTKEGPFSSLFDFCDRVDLSAVNRGTIEALVCAGAFDRTGAMRKALFDTIDSSISAGQSAQRDRRSGQMNMFGGEPEATASSDAPPDVSLGEWSEAEMLAREKAVLGFYITRHPLTSQEKLLEACATASTVDLAKYDEGATVIVGGIVSSLRTVIPRKGRNAGKRMGIVTLEDLKGRIEAVLFSDKLPTYQADLVPDAVLFLEGKVDRRREEPSLHVTRVVTAENAVKELATALLIDLAQDGPIEELVGLLRKSPGECRVYLNVATGQDLCAQIECHPSFSVSCTPELLGSIIKLLGAAAVHVLGPTHRPMTIPGDIVPQSPTAVAV